MRNYHQGDKWLPGTIEKQTGPVSFAVVLSDGRHRRCHQDQVRKRLLETEPLATEVTVDGPTPDPKMDDLETVPREPETGPMEPDIVRGPAVATPPKTYP